MVLGFECLIVVILIIIWFFFLLFVFNDLNIIYLIKSLLGEKKLRLIIFMIILFLIFDFGN